MIVMLTASVSPDADRTAAINSSRFCLFVPLLKFNMLSTNTLKLNVLRFNEVMCNTAVEVALVRTCCTVHKPHFWIHGHVSHHVFCG